MEGTATRVKRIPLCLLCVFVALALARAQDGPAQAIRLNNLGVAYLNQARVTDALDSFRQARQRDPSLFVALIGQVCSRESE